MTLPAEASDGCADQPPLAIVCGGGLFPFMVADAAKRAGRSVWLFPIRGSADPAMVARYPHHWVTFGQLGRFWRRARRLGCRDVVFIGSATRPAFREIRLDWTTFRLLPRLARMFRGGDDHLLSGLAKLFEERGFRMVGAHQVAPEILVPAGVLGRVQPTVRDHGDIARGLDLLHATGPFDLGQAAVVADNNVLALEGAEGTDAMLARVADLRQRGRVRLPDGVGVLVKAVKLKQDRRVDLPSIGTRTLEGAAEARLAGVAVLAGATIIAEAEDVLRLADRSGLFVIGVDGAERHAAQSDEADARQ